MANNFASIGMGISSPRLQSFGAGKWLAKHIQSQLEEHDVYLFTTKDSLPMCLNFGLSISKGNVIYEGAKLKAFAFYR
ncbi:hypothetical protein [Vibrio nigripulchritudo]|uniref:hypothetical protein n=1 Tax=Vibrio nigripulchritudo TaxID=28173 RepID=UPI00248F7AA6|nr:hypothetical protein [Vibrio nigripulchritudo]BDU41057.1 hypothetical protein TUMSATVNIG2_55260 [Vibrio nigripulchritudo]BDU46797.1 hypothetical protein TUMSATVNIG3_55950 [Vibrio nigripulchritudo]